MVNMEHAAAQKRRKKVIKPKRKTKPPKIRKPSRKMPAVARKKKMGREQAKVEPGSLKGEKTKAREAWLEKEERKVSAEFAGMMNEVLAGAQAKAEEITEEEILDYIRAAHARIPTNWRRFFSEVIDKAMKGRRTARPGGFMTMDEYVKVAMSIRPRPVPKKSFNDISLMAEKMVATRMPGMPKLKKEAVVAALELAALLEIYSKKTSIAGDLDFRKQWLKKKVV